MISLRSVLAVIAGSLAAGSTLAFLACSDGLAPPKRDGGGDGGAAFTYRGQSCQYDVPFPQRYGFTDLSLDDAAGPGSDPIRVRVGLGGGVTSGTPGYADPSRTAVFTWQTNDKVRAARVRFGGAPSTLTESRPGYSWTTPAPESGFGSNEPETYMHEVHVCGLEPAHTYYYQVGGGTPEVWSATQSFTTVPTDGKITIGISGDARDRVEVWQIAQRRMRDLGVALQLTTGDLVFIGPEESLLDTWLGAIWKDPADPSRFITLGQQSILFIAGNHEAESVRFYANVAMPGEGEYAESYASFDVGNTHFVMVDDQPVAALEGSDQGKVILDWLEADLGRAEANRAKVPFVVALSHRGLYTTSMHAQDGDVLVARKLLAPIYDKHHVDIVVNGHDHVFERTKPLRAGADPAGQPMIMPPGQGTQYVVVAGVGADPYAVGINPSDYREVSVKFGPDTPYIGFYAIVTLEGGKLTFTSYGLTGAGNDSVVDSFGIGQ
jgi:hypothetical protein